MPEATAPSTAMHRALCVVLVLAFGGGCSYMFVDGPPQKHRQMAYFQCTTSKAWPVVDTVFASAYMLQAATLAGLAASSDSSQDKTTGAAVTAGAALLFAASAYSGYGRTSDCREAIDDLQIRLNRMPAGAGPGPWPGGSPYQSPVPYDPWLAPPPRPFGTPAPAPAVPAPAAPAQQP